MVSVGDDIFKCKGCFDAGAELDGSRDDPESEGAEASGVVRQHAYVYVGMPYHDGWVLEIYPGWNRVTVQIDRGRHGCETQHLSLSKVAKKVSERLDEMD